MSKLSFSSNPLGAAVFTLATPGTNTDRTLTIPDVSATIFTTAGGTIAGPVTCQSPVTFSDLDSGEDLVVGSSVQSNARFKITNRLDGAGFNFDASQLTDGAANKILTWSTGGNERTRITSGGDFLVGTTNNDPTANRTNGTVIRSNGIVLTRSNQDWNIGTAGTSGTHIGFYTDNGTSRVLAGNISSNGATTTYNTTSDYRLKNFIAKVTDAGARLDSLNPVEYEWKADGRRTRGFFAHEFQAVYADSVTGTKDAVDQEGKPIYQSMQAGSSEVIADLVAEIQSLRKRLAALESKQ